MRILNQWPCVLIALASLTPCLALCSCKEVSTPGNKQLELEYERRVAVFQLLYTQIKQYYVKDDVLQLPEDIGEMAMTLQLHSSVSWDVLHHNSQPIPLTGDNEKSMHTMLLHDSADLGDGSSRVILFADGHVEISTWQ